MSGVTLDLQLIKGATNAILAGMNTLGAGGSFSSVTGFADAFDTMDPSKNNAGTGENCFRFTLLGQGIGVEN